MDLSLTYAAGEIRFCIHSISTGNANANANANTPPKYLRLQKNPTVCKDPDNKSPLFT